jgi:hypothetical protein
LCTLVSALKFISYCNLILLEYVCMNSESNSWPIILSRFKAIFTNFMAIALYPGVLLSKFRVCFDIYLEARPFHTLKPNINSMFSNICSFHCMEFLWGSLQPAIQKARSGPLTVLVKMFHWDTVTYNHSALSLAASKLHSGAEYLSQIFHGLQGLECLLCASLEKKLVNLSLGNIEELLTQYLRYSKC